MFEWNVNGIVHTNQSTVCSNFMHIGHQNGQTIGRFRSPLTATVIERQTKHLWIHCHCEHHMFKIVYWCETCKRHPYKFSSIAVHTAWKQNRMESSHISSLISVYNVEHWTLSVYVCVCFTVRILIYDCCQFNWLPILVFGNR